jgi:hypothetical protein
MRVNHSNCTNEIHQAHDAKYGGEARVIDASICIWNGGGGRERGG